MLRYSPVTKFQLDEAIEGFESLDLKRKLKRLDEISEDQPVASNVILLLHRYDVDILSMDYGVHVLLVLHECFTRAVPNLPTITDEMMENALVGISGIFGHKSITGSEEAKVLLPTVPNNHPEPMVMAYVIGYFAEFFASSSLEAEKVLYASLAVLHAFIEAKKQAEDKIDIISDSSRRRRR